MCVVYKHLYTMYLGVVRQFDLVVVELGIQLWHVYNITFFYFETLREIKEGISIPYTVLKNQLR